MRLPRTMTIERLCALGEIARRYFRLGYRTTIVELYVPLSREILWSIYHAEYPEGELSRGKIKDLQYIMETRAGRLDVTLLVLLYMQLSDPRKLDPVRIAQAHTTAQVLIGAYLDRDISFDLSEAYVVVQSIDQGRLSVSDCRLCELISLHLTGDHRSCALCECSTADVGELLLGPAAPDMTA
jgi:hypothetical protein